MVSVVSRRPRNLRRGGQILNDTKLPAVRLCPRHLKEGVRVMLRGPRCPVCERARWALRGSG